MVLTFPIYVTISEANEAEGKRSLEAMLCAEQAFRSGKLSWTISGAFLSPAKPTLRKPAIFDQPAAPSEPTAT